MERRNTVLRGLAALALSGTASVFLAGCGDGTTGGYPPPPPPYEPPPAELAKAGAPKFKPLIKALLAQRKAARGDLSGLAKTTDDAGNPLTSFAASRAAADALTEALKDAGLTADEQATWSVISSLDEPALEKLVQ